MVEKETTNKSKRGFGLNCRKEFFHVCAKIYYLFLLFPPSWAVWKALQNLLVKIFCYY